LELVASAQFLAVDRNGTESVIRVGVGRPSKQPTGEWACPTLTYDFQEPKPVYGEDSLQALCLGLYLIRSRLEGWLDLGGRLFAGEPPEEVNRSQLSAWFGALGTQND
jgi:hypothetical protein